MHVNCNPCYLFRFLFSVLQGKHHRLPSDSTNWENPFAQWTLRTWEMFLQAEELLTRLAIHILKSSSERAVEFLRIYMYALHCCDYICKSALDYCEISCSTYSIRTAVFAEILHQMLVLRLLNKCTQCSLITSFWRKFFNFNWTELNWFLITLWQQKCWMTKYNTRTRPKTCNIQCKHNLDNNNSRHLENKKNPFSGHLFKTVYSVMGWNSICYT